MKNTPTDFAALTIAAMNCGMIPYKNRYGHIEPGKYTLEGFQAPVDLSACAADEKSILRTALLQLSEQINESFMFSIGNDLLN